MPKMGMTMEEGTIIQWHKAEGQPVQKGEPLLEIMTDKVSLEVAAPASGILRGIRFGPQAVVPVTQVIAYIAAPDEKTEEAARPPEGVTRQVTPSTPLRASPAARRAARERGIDLMAVQGSGPDGRIVQADVEAFAAQALQQRAAVVPSEAPARVIPLVGMRRTIAERMQKSFREAPHISLTVEVDMAAAEEMRRQLTEAVEAEGSEKISPTAILVKAAALALKRHPLVNATLRGEEIHLLSEINIGVAVALDEGLIVPVIKGADRMGLTQIAALVSDLARRAREGKLTLDDVAGGTFTLTNLGMFGIDQFTAIVNPPHSAILATGRIVEKPVGVAGQIVLRPMMQMTISADHRVIDGVVAARFLQDVKRVLENPYLLLM
jgi:pyruvate dehydrogenase E2 component (dihydrolipoamide acetyltransferase)